MYYISFMKKLILYVILFNLIYVYPVKSEDVSPEPTTWNTRLKDAIFDEQDVLLDGSEIMNMESPYRALDAAIVPITIKFKIDQKDKQFIKKVMLIVDENPSPIVGNFNFSPKSGNASLTTRIRIDKYTYVRAIAETNDKKKYMVASFVKAAGGCSAPSLADTDAVMARLGRMKMKFIKTDSKNENYNVAEFLVSHPNFSGLQFNQLTRAEIPAHFINYVKIEQDDELILEATPDISLSEDPSFIFNYKDSGGPINVFVEDSEGQTFKKEFSTSNLVSRN